MIEGRLFFAQPAKGYRFNLDSVILARSVNESAQNGLDLGAGCGIVGQIVLSFGLAQRMTAVELCAEMVELAKQSAELNHFSQEQYTVVAADIRQVPLAAQQYDLIVCNPPFFQEIKGPMSPNEQRRLARHGAGESLEDWIRAIARFLAPQGWAYLIFPAESITRLLAAVEKFPLKISQIRFIHPFADQPANRVLLKMGAGKGNGGTEIAPPIVTFSAPGVYTPEVLTMLGRL